MSHIQMYDVTVDRCCPSSKKQKWIPVYRVPQREGRPPGQTWRWTPLPGLPDAYIRPGSGPQCSSDQRTQQHWSKSLKRKSYRVCWSTWKHQTDFEISFQVRRGLVPAGCEITSKLLDGGHRSSDEAKKGQKSIWCKTTSQNTNTTVFTTLSQWEGQNSPEGKTPGASRPDKNKWKDSWANSITQCAFKRGRGAMMLLWKHRQRRRRAAATRCPPDWSLRRDDRIIFFRNVLLWCSLHLRSEGGRRQQTFNLFMFIRSLHVMKERKKNKRNYILTAGASTVSSPS